MKEITNFESQHKLNAWAKKAGLKFASYIMCDEDAAEEGVSLMRRDGCAVVTCDRFLGDSRSAYVIFNR